MAHWRENIDPEIKGHFEKLVAESAKHKEAYGKSNDQAIAQLWTANAIQEKRLAELQEKIDVLEKAIRVLAGKGKLAEQAAMKTRFLEKALAEISGPKKEEVLENRRFSAPRDEVSMEKIDANKVMREVISRKAVKKEEAAETEEEPDEENGDEEDDEEEEEAAEPKKASPKELKKALSRL
ncbi:MAG TPA: hypothetical protein HA362_03040 [Nanoarchaeota archaeon]|nr:hypothetical protein [Nanoarchaeota archaeon]